MRIETQTEASQPQRIVADLDMAAKAKEASDFLKALAHEGRLMIRAFSAMARNR